MRHTWAFRRMAAVQFEDVRGHRALKGVPYVPRDCEPDVEQRLQDRRLLIIGAAMSGKTRLALQLTRDIFPDHGFVDAVDGAMLRAMLEGDPLESALVVWLDDLARFLGADAVTPEVLDLLHSRGNVVVATMGSAAYDDLTADTALRPAGWGVPGWFGEPIRLSGWSDREFAKAARRGVADKTLSAARRLGLSACVGGGPVLVRRLRAGNTTHPVGCAVVRAAADWRRTGTSAPLSRAALVDLLPAYLRTTPDAVDPEALLSGLSWATTRVNGVALMHETESGFVVLDYILDDLRSEGWPIPEPLWEAVLAQSRPRVLIDVGYHAVTSHARPDIAMAAFRIAAAAEDRATAAAGSLGMETLSELTDDVGGAEPELRGEDAAVAPVAQPAIDHADTARFSVFPTLAASRSRSDADRPGLVDTFRDDASTSNGPADAKGADTRSLEDAPKAALDLGMDRLKHRDLGGALAAWQQAVESDHPEHAPAAALCMASVLNHRGDADSAAAAYQIAIDSGHPDHGPEAALGLANLREAQGDLRSAAAAYRIALDSGHATYAATAGAKLSSLASLTTDNDLLEQAAAYQQKIDAADPDEAPRAALLLALLRQSQNDTEAEAAAYQIVIDYRHRELLPIAAYNLGVLREESGALDEAASAWALAIHSGDATYAPMAAYNLGLLHKEQGNSDAASAAWRAAVDSRDAEYGPAAALELGDLRRDLGDFDNAAAWWQMALGSGNPEYAPPAAFNLGVLRQARDDVDGAVSAWQYAIDSRHLDSAPAAALRLGHLRRAQGDLHRAAASYQLTIDSGHKDAAPEAAIYLGLLLDEHGDIAGAAAAYQVAIDSHHETEAPEAAVRLGLLMEKRGEIELASAAYKIALDSREPVRSAEAQAYLSNLERGVSNLSDASAAADTTPELKAVSIEGLDTEFQYLSSDQGRRLRVLVRDAFLVRGVDVTMFAAYAEGTDGTRYGLHEIAAHCHNAPGGHGAWPAIVNDQVARILRGVRKKGTVDDLTVEDVFSRALLRVYDRGSLGDSDGYGYARPVVGDLVELLVLDHTESVQILHRTQLERLDWNALHSAALAHLLAEPIDDHAVFTQDGGTIHVAYGESTYIASKLLILPDVLARTLGTREPAHGVLVAVPNLHEIAFHPIVDPSVVRSLHQLSEFAGNAFTDEEGAVSPFVFWWQAGRLTQLTRYDAGGHIVPDVDEAFQEVLNGLIAGG